MFNFNTKKTLFSVTTIFVLFLAPFFNTQTAEATGWPVVDVVGNVIMEGMAVALGEIAASTAITAEATQALQDKDFGLDGVAFVVAKAMLNKIVNSTIDWVNSGFDGSPFYIEDFGQFATEVGDSVVKHYIDGTKELDLCEGFDSDIRTTLMAATSKEEKGCTLGLEKNSIQKYYDDLDDNWDWDTWEDITQNPNNNMFDSYVKTSVEMDKEIRNAVGSWTKEMDWGSGFLSQKKCEETEVLNERTGVTEIKNNCKTVTMGDTFANAVNNNLNYGGEALIEADEFNELIGAFITQLLMKVFTEDGFSGQNDPENKDAILDRDSNIAMMEADLQITLDFRSANHHYLFTQGELVIMPGFKKIIATCPMYKSWAESKNSSWDNERKEVQHSADKGVVFRDWLKENIPKAKAATSQAEFDAIFDEYMQLKQDPHFPTKAMISRQNGLNAKNELLIKDIREREKCEEAEIPEGESGPEEGASGEEGGSGGTSGGGDTGEDESTTNCSDQKDDCYRDCAFSGDATTSCYGKCDSAYMLCSYSW